MDKDISIRILQLKNNFYRDDVAAKKDILGEYCVIGYFDAFDISKADMAGVTEFNTWNHLGDLTTRLDGTVSCRMLVCVTERQEEDREFWEDQSDMLYFVTMVRVKAGTTVGEMQEVIEKLNVKKKRIGYLSYDHSEIIVVAKTNRYSEGIEGVRELRRVCRAVKTYTVFAIREKFLESYDTIKGKLVDEKISCRLHCMVKDYEAAEAFRVKLEEHMKERNGKQAQIHRFDTFGGCDWLLEIDDVSICSVFECYKMKKLLTHTNELYNTAFYNIESEILVGEGRQDGRDMDRGTEGTADGKVQ